MGKESWVVKGRPNRRCREGEEKIGRLEKYFEPNKMIINNTMAL